MWPNLHPEIIAHLPRPATGSSGTGVGSDADSWKKCINRLLEIRLLEADWDGQGTPAPAPALVDSAIVLAVLLRQLGAKAPDLTVQTPAETVAMEWWGTHRSEFSIDVREPFEADVYTVADGTSPSNYWEIHGVDSAMASTRAIGA